MAHLVETMVSTSREWHHYLTAHAITDKPMVPDEAMSLGGLDWEVEKRKLYTLCNDGQHREVKWSFALTRISDEKVLSVVGDNYKPFQNRSLFDVFGELTRDTGVFRYQTAGSLREGRTVFALGQFVKEYEVVKGDTTKTYLFGVIDHSGKESVRFFRTGIRVVCNNTATAAIRQADSNKIVRIPHLGDMELRLDQARVMLDLVHLDIESQCEAMKQLQSIVMTSQVADRFLESMWPTSILLSDGASKLDEVKADMEAEKARAIQTRVAELAEVGRGTGEFPMVRGTAYGWFNAVTEYTTHEQKRSDRSLGGQLLASATGEAGKINKRALKLLTSSDLLSV